MDLGEATLRVMFGCKLDFLAAGDVPEGDNCEGAPGTGFGHRVGLLPAESTPGGDNCEGLYVKLVV